MRRLLLLPALLLSGEAMTEGPVEWREIVEQPRPEPGLRVNYGEAESQFGELYLPEGEGLVVFEIADGDWPRNADDIVIDSFSDSASAIMILRAYSAVVESIRFSV